MDPTITQYQKLLDNYASVLEKTNQQLGLWSNPYGVAVGILSVLIAVIAIAVGYALWRNSKEQRERFEKFVSEQEKIFTEQNKIRNTSVRKAEAQLDELINQYKKRLDSATKEGKKDLQKAIENLAKEKASIGAYIGPTGPVSSDFGYDHVLNSVIFGRRERSMICSNCGKSFSFIDDSDRDILASAASYVLGQKSKTVHCTHCGATNIQS